MSDLDKDLVILMATNGQEFVLENTVRVGEYLLLSGYITRFGGYPGNNKITFLLPATVAYRATLRLGYYANYNHVLVDVTNEAKNVNAYLSDTPRPSAVMVPWPS